MFKSLKRRVALGAVAAVGAAGLVTIAAPAANAAAISSFTVAVYPQRAVTGSASSITALVTTAGAETGTIRGIITSAPTPAAADSLTQVVAGDTLTAYAVNWSLQVAGVAFAASTQSGATAKSFNTAGTYGVNWFFDRNSNNLIDADEPFLVSSFAIGGVPASLSLSTAALTVAGTGAKTYSVILKDTAGNVTMLAPDSAPRAERITVLASVPATLADSMTVTPQNADGAAARIVKAKGSPNTTNTAATTILPGDTSTASTGGYSIKANFDAATASGVGTLVFNLGGSLTPTTAVTGTLTMSAAAYATSIAVANTSGVTASSGANKPGGTAVSTNGKYVAPYVMDSGTATTFGVQANAVTAAVLNFNLVGTAGSIVNVTVATSTADNGVVAGTTPVTLDANGKGTYSVTPTTATGTITVTTPIKDAAGTAQATGYAVTYTAASVSAGAAAAMATNGITSSPDLSTVTSTIVKPGNKNDVKITVKDQYGTAKQYYAVTGTLSSTSRNYGVTIAQQFTDANGEATISFTDASTSTTNLADVLTIQVTAPGSATGLLNAGNVLNVNYSSTGTYSSLTVTGGTTTTTTISRNVLQLVNSSTTPDDVALVPSLKDSTGAAVSGVALTWTGSAGVYFRLSGERAAGVVGGEVKTVTASSTTTVYAYGTKPGVATVTVTGGGVSGTATFTVAALSGVTTARNIALTAVTNKFTAVVTDGWGNPVSGVTVSFATTSQGIFGGGVTSTSAVTDENGAATAVVNSADGKAGDVTVTASVASTNTGAQALTPLTNIADVPAIGFKVANTSATAKGSVTATAATTATTDAATTSKINDIATAVANLSTTVAGLVASLVAQIKDTKAAIADTKAALDKLAAVVAKIQKKVKA